MGVFYHDPTVSFLACAPDSRRVAVGLTDGKIHLHDVHIGRRLALLCGHRAPVYSVAFSPDGENLVSGSEDKTVRIWYVQPVYSTVHVVLRGHDGKVKAVQYSPNGRLILSGSEDNTVRVWDAKSGRLVTVLRGHEGPVDSVAFSSDGRRIASGSSASYRRLLETVRIWDTETFKCLEVIKGGGDLVGILQSVNKEFPWRALVRDQETVVEDTDTGIPIAWLSQAMFNVSTSPRGRVWAGPNDARSSTCIFQLEGANVRVTRKHRKSAAESDGGNHAPNVPSAAQEPETADWECELSFDELLKPGNDLFNRGELGKALATYRESLLIAERFAGQVPGNIECNRMLSVVHDKIGDVFVSQGKWAAAAAAYRRSLDIIDGLVEHHPHNAACRRERMVINLKMGDAFMADADCRGAIKALRTGYRLAASFASTSPDNDEFEFLRMLSLGSLIRAHLSSIPGRLVVAALAIASTWAAWILFRMSMWLLIVSVPLLILAVFLVIFLFSSVILKNRPSNLQSRLIAAARRRLDDS